ncbi:MAG: hypothetical protein ACLUGP_01825 [Faecalibacterium prausnitzii]
MIRYTADQLARDDCFPNDVALDVLQMTGNDHDLSRPPIRWNWPR